MRKEDMKWEDILDYILAFSPELKVVHKESFQEIRNTGQPHLHDSWELKLLPDYATLLIIPPYTPHATIDACPLVLRTTESIIKLESYANLITEVTSQYWAKIFSSFAELLVFYHDKNSASEFETFHLLFTVLSDFCEEHRGEFVTDRRRCNLFANATMLIERLYVNPNLSVEDITSMLQVTPQHLNRIFRKNSDRSIRASIIQTRLEKAADLLLNTEYSVVEIAELTGWNSTSYFSLAFKKAYRMAPSTYRKNRVLKKAGK